MSEHNLNSDQQIIARLKAGDKVAFDQIYFGHAEALYKFAYNILRDEDECTDTVQEVFVWLWKNKERLEITDLRRYLTAAVKYRLSRTIQRSKRRSEILASSGEFNDSVTDHSLELKELKHAISQFIDTLPPRAKEIFYLSRNEYLSNKEIAARLQISEKTVENQMTISLRKLKLTLGKMSFWSVFL